MTPSARLASRSSAVFIALLLGSVILTGCNNPERPEAGSSASSSPSIEPSASPSEVPSPEPTDTAPISDPRHPPIEELVITGAGLGSLVNGGPIGDSDMAILDPEYCADAHPDIAAGDPRLGRWIADYPDFDDPRGYYPPRKSFSLGVTDGVVMGTQVFDPRIPTETGITVGVTLRELRVAYPGLLAGGSDERSSVFYVDSDAGRLVFEVAHLTAETPDLEDFTVEYIISSAVQERVPTPTYGSDNTGGNCDLKVTE